MDFSHTGRCGLTEKERTIAWERIHKADQRRKALLRREKFEGSLLHIFCQWKGTIWHAAATNPFFYFSLLFWLLPVVAKHWWKELYDKKIQLTTVDVSRLSAIGSFVSFFLVFYINHGYNRWCESYRSSMSCEGLIFNIAAMCRGCLGRENKYAAQILRYANLIHLLGYVGLTPEYDNTFFQLVASDLNLCSEKEMVVLMSIGPNNGGRCYREVTTWAVEAIERARRADLFTAEAASYMQSSILSLRGALATLYDNYFQPIPFVYFNMANWLVIIYPPLFNYAIAQAVESVWTSLIIVLFVSVCFLGLPQIAKRFLYPYGADYEDFAVYHFINETAVNSLAMLDYHFDLHPDEGRASYLSYKPEGEHAQSAASAEAKRMMKERGSPREAWSGVVIGGSNPMGD